MTRLDQALVERALCDSRERAKRLILAGVVRVNGHPAKKASDNIKPGGEIQNTQGAVDLFSLIGQFLRPSSGSASSTPPAAAGAAALPDVGPAPK